MTICSENDFPLCNHVIRANCDWLPRSIIFSDSVRWCTTHSACVYKLAHLPALLSHCDIIFTYLVNYWYILRPIKGDRHWGRRAVACSRRETLKTSRTAIMSLRHTLTKLTMPQILFVHN